MADFACLFWRNSESCRYRIVRFLQESSKSIFGIFDGNLHNIRSCCRVYCCKEAELDHDDGLRIFMFGGVDIGFFKIRGEKAFFSFLRFVKSILYYPYYRIFFGMGLYRRCLGMFNFFGGDGV